MGDEQLHLFDDKRWQAPPRRVRAPRETCCRAWVDYTSSLPGTKPSRLFEVVHMLGHSRVPFTDLYVAEQAHCTVDAARWACSRAKRLGWIKPPRVLDGAVHKGHGRMWTGALPRRA